MLARKGRLAGKAVEVAQAQVHPGAAGDGEQVNDGIGRAADRHVGPNSVLECGAG